MVLLGRPLSHLERLNVSGLLTQIRAQLLLLHKYTMGSQPSVNIEVQGNTEAECLPTDTTASC